jgi:Zn-dependent protease
MGGSDFLNIFAVALYMTAQISVFLAVFNLIPLPPLDGSKILYFFLSARQIHAFERHSHIVRMALLISLIFFRERNPILWLIGTVSRYIMLFLDTITFFLR